MVRAGAGIFSVWQRGLGDTGNLGLGGSLPNAETFAARAYQQLVGGGDCLSPLMEGPDKSGAGRQDLIQTHWGLGQVFRFSKEPKYSAEEPRQMPINEDLANMAGWR